MNDWSWLYTLLLAFVLGTNLGSFFNVVIYRFPLGKSVVSPASACPNCDYVLKWFDNIPIFSWMILGGKCRICKAPISSQYWLVEFGTGLLGLLGVYLSGIVNDEFNLGHVLGGLLLLYIVIPIFVIDIKHYLIPDLLVFPCAAMAVVLAFVFDSITWWDSLVSGLGSGLGLWLFAFIISKILKKDAMGFGDIKLVAFFGFLMGWQNALLSVVIGSFLGLIVMLPLQKIGKHDGAGVLPFGPFLHSGAIIAYFWGNILLLNYFKILGA